MQPHLVQQEMNHFLKKCVMTRPEQRASMDQLLMHPFIGGQRNGVATMAEFGQFVTKQLRR